VQVLQEEEEGTVSSCSQFCSRAHGAREGTWVSSLPPMCSLSMNTRGTVVPPVICFNAA
jgi:hypothetical protein